MSSSLDEVQLAAETPLETFRYLTVYSVSELEATEGFMGGPMEWKAKDDLMIPYGNLLYSYRKWLFIVSFPNYSLVIANIAIENCHF